jgi:hypothetical protein
MKQRMGFRLREATQRVGPLRRMPTGLGAPHLPRCSSRVCLFQIPEAVTVLYAMPFLILENNSTQNQISQIELYTLKSSTVT